MKARVGIASVLIIILVTNSTVLFFTTTKTKAQFDDCDSSYPDLCTPSPPPNLNCSDISDKKFRVFSPDPHGFDRDGDGIGCES